jgi:hypothetical protein
MHAGVKACSTLRQLYPPDNCTARRRFPIDSGRGEEYFLAQYKLCFDEALAIFNPDF